MPLSSCLSLSFSPDAHKKETLFFFLISSIFHPVCEANREENKKELEEEEIQQRERERRIIVKTLSKVKAHPPPPMDSASSATAAAAIFNERESMVDPFLVEALQNPRHRLTSLSPLS